jgi:hypothetical protein
MLLDFVEGSLWIDILGRRGRVKVMIGLLTVVAVIALIGWMLLGLFWAGFSLMRLSGFAFQGFKRIAHHLFWS